MKPDARISSSVITSTGTACSSTFLAKRDPRTETELPETALDASEKFAVAEPSTFTETLADSYPMYEAVTVYAPLDTPSTEYDPSAAVAAPDDVPSTVTFAPKRALPAPSVTVPETEPCANIKPDIITSAITLYSFLIVFLPLFMYILIKIWHTPLSIER